MRSASRCAVRTGRCVPSSASSAQNIRAVAEPIVPALHVGVNPFRIFERQLGQPRFLASIVSTLSILIALTVIGVFGVVSHYAARRTREVGIRMALGAGSARICHLILWRAAMPAVAGIGAGLAVSFW